MAATQKRNPQARMDGQFNFCSGWEWGYWFNDVITARAAWNPETASTTRYAALANAFSEVTRIFGPAAANVRSVRLDCGCERPSFNSAYACVHLCVWLGRLRRCWSRQFKHRSNSSCSVKCLVLLLLRRSSAAMAWRTLKVLAALMESTVTLYNARSHTYANAVIRMGHMERTVVDSGAWNMHSASEARHQRSAFEAWYRSQLRARGRAALEPHGVDLCVLVFWCEPLLVLLLSECTTLTDGGRL